MKNADLALRRAVDAIACLADPEPPWKDILQTARALLGGDGASFVVFEGAQLATFESVDNDATAVQAYLSHFSAQDIGLSTNRLRPPGTWIDTESLLSPWQRGRNAYYVDFMCRYRVRQMISLIVEETPERAASISMQREVADPRSAQQLASRSVTRYTHAVLQAAARRRAAAARWTETAEAANGAFGEASLLVNSRAVVLRASANAAPMLDGAASWCMAQGKLWHADPHRREALSRALLSVHLSGRPVRLSFAEGRAVCRLDLARAHRQLRLGNESLVFIRWRNEHDPSALRIDTLCQVFELTPAEARVLAALAGGQTPGAQALARGVSINAVRKQIATVMDKLGCTRQVDLVRAALATESGRGWPC